jgi:exopolysaccharide production protein ExoZ
VTIQYLRTLAASLLAFHHAMAPPAVAPYYSHQFAQFGVDLFFVISGYIMWATTAAAPPSPPSFWLARIVRIAPLYWVFTTLFITVSLVAPQALFNPPVLDPFLILKSYLFVPASLPPVYTLGWTLNYEMFFYLVFGLCLLVPQRPAGDRHRGHPRRACRCRRVRFAQQSDPVSQHQFDHAGIPRRRIIAAAGSRLARLPPPVGVALIGAGILAVGHYAWAEQPGERYLALGIPAALIVTGSLVFEPKARLAPSRLGLLLGDASYSIYLAHSFALRLWYLATNHLITAIGTPVALTLYVLGALVCGVAGGVVSYLLLERPLLAAGRKLTGRKPVRSPAYA